jgi:hypothetical protein
LDGHVHKHRFEPGVFGVRDESSDWGVQNNDRNLTSSKLLARVIGCFGERNVDEILCGEIFNHRLG